MSGSASVPFTIAAVFAGEKYQQVILTSAAVFCVYFATWRVWATERERVIALHGQADLVAATREQTAAIKEQAEQTRLLRESARDGDSELSPSARAFAKFREEQTLEFLRGKLPSREEKPPTLVSPNVGTMAPATEIAIQDAAQLAYENAEKNGWLDIVVGTSSDPEDRLTSFKYMMLVQATEGAVALIGVKPPSRQSYPIPKDELQYLHPAKGESALLFGTRPKAVYHSVVISRADLEKVIETYHLAARME
jgi:hypothetical protein